MAPTASSSATTSVQVAVRIRPTTTHDASSIPNRFQRNAVHAIGSTVVVDSVSGSVPSATGNGPMSPSAGSGSGSGAGGGKKQTFTFDHVLPPDSTQHQVFTATAQPLISRFVQGFNCTMLAYGQTSSGKTFTMTGIDLDADPSDATNGMGIIPRSVATIFARTHQQREESNGSWTCSLKGSFLELYNEDLIDLLDDSPSRRDVQIREDKEGHIILGGLREVPVRNPTEVMGLIRQGTSLRRTNETDMNAQSSRSHAIFSLTLTQRKFTGSGAPPRSASPLPPGRSPSRLTRPGSMLPGASSRLSMPMSRPGTPSFQRTPGLRPASSLGVNVDNRPDEQSGEGEWVTVVSKFNFVDLAGSERLKRTAAQGERVKEGISINSGLLALGNVISALGDPSRSKSNTAMHVPYRDSKLTRLLQDSLGGNAHTLMIACVSPAEWNALETINTLKYANRARNIKNRAVVAEKEEGWEDVEWLQGTVVRLRKELKGIKDGGSAGGGVVLAASGSLESNTTVTEGASRRVRDQLVEVQNNYENLRSKYTQRTEELTRLRHELTERPAEPQADTGGTAKYEELVGPVIEEYEKTISAMEAELSLNRAALRHTNDLVEEKEEELSAALERTTSAEMYIEELKTRVAKLSEREASTEAYVHDLEEKVRNYDEKSVSSSGSITDLKRELARFRDTDSHSAQYILDLEAKLGKADESVLSLRQMVERLEHEVESRRAEVETLQNRLDALAKDGESWRGDLERREKRVQELEQRLQEWERVRSEAGEERTRLGVIVNGVKQEKEALQSSPPATPTVATIAIPKANGHAPSEPATPVQRSQPSSGLDIEVELASLQETHAATLADLSSVAAKYRDALREISDLAAQIQELKLGNVSSTEDSSAPSPIPSPEKPELQTPVLGRRRMGSDTPNRRLFFRHAASTESLHSRSMSQSLSLSQELSSAHGRKTSFSSNGTSSPLASPRSRPSLSVSLSASSLHDSADQRSVVSMEKEIMRLQEVLKERETEIAVLETSLKEHQHQQPHQQQSLAALNADVPSSPDSPSPNGVNGAVAPQEHLSPKTLHHFGEIRKAMGSNGYVDADTSSSVSAISEADENLDRLNELMRSMAQKESTHREIVDDLTGQLTQVRRQHEELTTLSRDQAINMSSELEGMRKEHLERLSQLEAVERRELDLMQALQVVNSEHDKAVAELKSSHETALHAKEAEVDALIASIKAEHEIALSEVHSKLSAATTALESAHIEHEKAFGQLKAEHEEAQRQRAAEANELLTRARQEHEDALARLVAEHEAEVKRKDEEAQEILAKTEEDYYNALTRLRDDHAQRLEKQAAEAAATLARMREEHEGEIRVAELTREASLSESQSGHFSVLEDIQKEHASAIMQKESSFKTELEIAKAQHQRMLAEQEDRHQTALDRLQNEHAAAVAKSESENRRKLEEVASASSGSLQEAQAASARARQEADETVRIIQEQQASVLQEVERGHEEQIESFKGAHSTALAMAAGRTTEVENLLQAAHLEIVQAKAETQRVLTETNARLDAVQEEHVRDIIASREQAEQHASAEKTRLEHMLSELNAQHAQERDTLRKSHDLVAEELAVLKASSSQHVADRDVLRTERDSLVKELATVQALLQNHAVTVDSSEAARNALAADLAAQSALARQHAAERNQLQQGLDAVIAESASFKAQAQAREGALAELRRAHEDTVDELASHKAAAEEHLAARAAHESTLQEKTTLVTNVSADLASARTGVSTLEAKVAALEAELASAHAAHQQDLSEKTSMVASTSVDLSAAQQNASAFEAQIARLHAELDSARTTHEQSLQEKSTLAGSASAELIAARDDASALKTEVAGLRAELEAVRAAHDRNLGEKASSVADMTADLEAARVTASTLQAQVASLQHDLEATRDKHDRNLGEKASLIESISAELVNVRNGATTFESELASMKSQLATAHEAQSALQQATSKRDSLAVEMEKQRALLAEVQEELQRTRDARDALQLEKTKQENAVRELEARLARTPSPEAQPSSSIRSRMTSLPPAKLPPAAPPPSGPPPPPPSGLPTHVSDASFSSSASTNSALSRDSGIDSTTPTTSVTTSVMERTVQDPKLVAQVAAQGKQLEEQEAMIKTLNKQLTHCESDLQAHMDLVATLETSLGDCEKNLRKARMQATEIARERDSLTQQVDGLRRDVTNSRQEAQSVRQSIVEEKQSLESRLNEERRAKERARADLDARMVELTKRKSKFACL